MRYHICDKTLSESEIQYINETKTFDCCSVCLEVAMDAAYSDGFIKEDPLDDPEIEDQFGDGLVETLEADAHFSSFQRDDVNYNHHYNLFEDNS